MSNQAVLAHIARLESELARIQGELLELRALVGGPVRRRTQAFAATPELSTHPREAPTREMPAQSEARITRPEPSIPVASETVPTSDRRHAGRRTGLTDFPPTDGTESVRPTHPSTPRVSLNDPAAGRYTYYDEQPARDGKASRRR